MTRWCLLLLLPLLAAAAPDGVYCTPSGTSGAINALAVAPAARGALRFRLSLWSVRGRNLTLSGTASPTPKGWAYKSGPDCRLEILSTGGAVRIAPIAGADCRNTGGYGTRVPLVRFPEASRQGGVGEALRDPEAFQRVCTE